MKGVRLLQDATDPTAYYYVPQYPRLATKEDGSYELLCLKYVDAQGGTNGGLLHALIEFTLPPDQLEQVLTEHQLRLGPIQEILALAAVDREHVAHFQAVPGASGQGHDRLHIRLKGASVRVSAREPGADSGDHGSPMHDWSLIPIDSSLSFAPVTVIELMSPAA